MRRRLFLNGIKAFEAAARGGWLIAHGREPGPPARNPTVLDDAVARLDR